MRKYDWNVDLLKEVVKDCINFREVLDKLKIPVLGNNTKTLRNILDRENIDYSHFTGRAREYSKPGVKDINYYLSNLGKITSNSLKLKLLECGLKENKCEICGLTEWQGKPLIMLLHHIDGNNNNNSLDNLQMLCPNCHSQTDNYCGSANTTSKKYYCECGREIKKGSKYCPVCAHKHLVELKGKCPEFELLIQDFLEYQSFSGVASKYNVTDNSVRKWFKKFGLPYYAKELKEYLKNTPKEDIKEQTQSLIITRQSQTTKNKYDHNLILKLIDLHYTTKEISNYIGCSVDTIKSIGSKNKHSIRKANIKCIKCYKNNNLIKICFGVCQTADWLINEMNYKEYSERSLENLIGIYMKTKISIGGINFISEDLPPIESIINDETKIKELFNLYYNK